MKKYIYLALQLFLVFSMFSCSSVPLLKRQENVPFFQNFKINEYELKNGLQVFIVQDKSSPTAAFQLWYKVGSKDEQKKYTGLAHLFEHMMFKKTKNLKEGQFDRELESLGVIGTNAFTNNDNTVYIHELPKSALNRVLELEAERMQNLVVDEEAFATEREVVKNERKMRNDNNPRGQIFQKLMETAFTTHSYHWPVIGYEEDLNRMNAKDALAFYKRYYAPNNAMIVIVGDVNPSDTIKLIHSHFHKIPPTIISRQTQKTEPPQKKARHKTLRLNLESESMYMGYKVPEVSHKDTPVFEVLQALLTDGRSSRLTKKLVDSGISTSISSGSFMLHDPGLFIFTSNLQKGKQATQAEKIILSELNNLIKNPPSDEELKRAKNLILYTFYSSFVTNKSKAMFIGSNASKSGSYQEGLDRLNLMLEVTPADLKRIIQTYFNPNQRTVIIGVPKRG